MNCQDTRDLLELFVLGDLDGAALRPQRQAVQDHLDNCPDCTAEAAAIGQAIALLRAERQATTTPTPSFARRLGHAIEAETARTNPRVRHRLILRAAALAASILLVGSLGVILRPVWHTLGGQPAKDPRLVPPTVSAKAPAAGNAARAPAVEIWQLPGALATLGELGRGQLGGQLGGQPAGQPTADEAVIVRGQDLFLLMNDKGTARAAALDASSHRIRWMSQIECGGNLAVDGDRVYCLAPSQAALGVSGDGPGSGQDRKGSKGSKGSSGSRTDLVALRISDGALIWRFGQDHPGRMLQPCRPIPLPGSAGDGGSAGSAIPDRVCWTTDASVLMLRGSDGQLLWRCPLAALKDVGALSAARVLNDRLYVATGKALIGLSLATGEPVERIDWPTPRGGPAWGRAAGPRPLLEVSGDRLIASIPAPNGGSQVICLSPGNPPPSLPTDPALPANDNQSAWKVAWSTPMPLTFHLLATPERIYVRSAGTALAAGPPGQPGLPSQPSLPSPPGVCALDIATGQPIWHQPADGCSPVTADRGTIYFLDTSKDHEKLVALDGRTGALAWQFAGLKSCDAFVKIGQTGFVKTQDGVLRALALASRL